MCHVSKCSQWIDIAVDQAFKPKPETNIQAKDAMEMFDCYKLYLNATFTIDLAEVWLEEILINQMQLWFVEVK